MKPEEPDRPESPQTSARGVVAGVIAALLLLGLLVWTVQLLVEQQRLERCLASKRPDCFRIDSPAREGPADLRR